jgi:hypothetical protein
VREIDDGVVAALGEFDHVMARAGEARGTSRSA